MRLLKEIIQRRLEVAKDYGLNNEVAKEIWVFYEIYKLCISYLGVKDFELKKKLLLIKRILVNPEDLESISKLRSYIAKDSMQIEYVLNSIEETEELEEVTDDFYPPYIVGVYLYDR